MKFFKKTDLIIIGILIAISGIGLSLYHFFAVDEQVVAQIYYESQLVKTIALDKGKDETFSIPEKPQVVFHLYEDGSIAFEESDCKDQICVHAGKLHSAGEFAACLPNEIVLKIVPFNDETNEGADLVIGNGHTKGGQKE